MNEKITNVFIENIVVIGNSAFFDYKELKSISLKKEPY